VPVALSLVAVPYIVSGLGVEAYGVYGIVSIAAGYLAMFSTPVASGNVRFMAEAYGRRDWHKLRQFLFTGVVVNSAISVCGALAMFLAANILAEHVFKISRVLFDSAVMAFRIAAASFFLNGVAASLRSVPTAMRRYDVVSIVNAIVGTAGIGGSVLAVWLGWGLLGVVTAQFLSSAMLVVGYGIVVRLLYSKWPASDRSSGLDKDVVRHLFSFSTLLFGGHVIAQVGYSIDRTLVGILLGASAVTFYKIPARITDQVPGFVGNFLVTLYPLAAESQVTGRLDELRRLYERMIRWTFWLSAFIGTMLIILSRDILWLWVGPAIAKESWMALALLAASAIWRAPRNIAFQVIIGLNKAQVDLVGSAVALFVVGTLAAILTPRFGISGAALSVLLGQAPIGFAYDVFTQRRLLGQENWLAILSPYVRVGGATLGTLAIAALYPTEAAGWGSLIAKASLFALVFTALSLAVGALRTRDIRFVLNRYKGYEVTK
jgi:O-antigen/teichoic acid export membrane protein